MSTSSIPEKIKTRIWVKAGGRCQYDGCNIPLWRDELTMGDMNSAYIAHIVADKIDGPRGDEALSAELRQNLSNLMLMCDVHHRLIDKEKVSEHPAALLRLMKETHENRIEILTAIQPNKKSEIILYGANVGSHSSPLKYEGVREAIVPNYFPQNSRAVELGMYNVTIEDEQKKYWEFQEQHLVSIYEKNVLPRLKSGDAAHISVFALAPQPLLMRLGHLLGDINPAEVYQLQREPKPQWKWHPDSDNEFEYLVHKPENTLGQAVLVFSLSSDVDLNRIKAVLGEKISPWVITIVEPNNDFLKQRKQLSMFRKTVRKVLAEIKSLYPKPDEILHVFPAMPVAAAVEFGRVIMPKADLKMTVYDQNKKNNGFEFALNLNH